MSIEIIPEPIVNPFITSYSYSSSYTYTYVPKPQNEYYKKNEIDAKLSKINTNLRTLLTRINNINKRIDKLHTI